MIRLGIDLGGTNIAAGLTDETGKLLCRHSNPTGVGRAREEILLRHLPHGRGGL